MDSRQQRLGEHYSRYNTNTEQIIGFNKNNYNSNDFDQVFSQQNNNLSTKQEPDMEYEKTERYLIVNSKDRDTVTYPSSSNFVVNLDQSYKNVCRVELIQAIIPDKNNVGSEPYLLLNIKELENTMDSNNKELFEAFSILQLNEPTIPGTFIQLLTRIHQHVVLNYKTPKATLSKLTVSVTDSEGNLFNFGGNGNILKATQVLFVFKVTTFDTSQRSISQRNVY